MNTTKKICSTIRRDVEGEENFFKPTKGQSTNKYGNNKIQQNWLHTRKKLQHISGTPYIDVLKYAEKIFVHSLLCRITCNVLQLNVLCALFYNYTKLYPCTRYTYYRDCFYSRCPPAHLKQPDIKRLQPASVLFFCGLRIVSCEYSKIELILSLISISSACFFHHFVIWFCSQSMTAGFILCLLRVDLFKFLVFLWTRLSR